VWVAGEEEVEERLLDKILHPWHAAYAEWVKEERAHRSSRSGWSLRNSRVKV
jgi:hypothetical protein